jgi:hypothetical protein
VRVEVGTLLACASCRKTDEEPSFQTTLGRQEVVAAVWRKDEMEAMAFIAMAAVMLVVAFWMVGLIGR